MRPEPMKVWVAEAHWYDGAGSKIIGVFSREDDAIAAAKSFRCCWWDVTEFEVQDA